MKSALRKEMLGLRLKLSPSELEEKSIRICQRLISLEIFQDSLNIMAYMPFRNEVNTLPLIDYCLANNKRVILPVSLRETRQLLLSELKDPDSELRTGTYGILEPAPQFLRPFPQDRLDLILVPAVAFDLQGHRLGYGAGYYDRFLDSIDAKVNTAGLAFELQVIDKVPVQPTDLPVDRIITENRILNCP